MKSRKSLRKFLILALATLAWGAYGAATATHASADEKASTPDSDNAGNWVHARLAPGTRMTVTLTSLADGGAPTTAVSKKKKHSIATATVSTGTAQGTSTSATSSATTTPVASAAVEAPNPTSASTAGQPTVTTAAAPGTASNAALVTASAPSAPQAPTAPPAPTAPVATAPISSSSTPSSTAPAAGSTAGNVPAGTHRADLSSYTADPASKDSRSAELSEDEIARTFINLHPVVTGKDPNLTVTLKGQMFRECNDFRFEKVMRKGQIAWIVTDGGPHDIPGTGRKCVADARSKGETCDLPGTCVPISEMPGTKITTSAMTADASIGLMQTDPKFEQDEPQHYRFTDFDASHPIQHASAQTIAARRQDAETKRREKVIAELKREIVGCRHNEDQLAQARSALEALADLTNLSEKDIETYKRQLRNAEFQLLSKRLLQLKTNPPKPDKIEAVMDDLQNFAEENDDEKDNYSDKVARLEADLAQRIVNNNAGSADSYAMAGDVLSGALGLPDISDPITKAIQQGQKTFELGRVTAMAMDPTVGNDKFVPAYQGLVNDVMQDMNGSCQMATMANLMNCRQAQQSYQMTQQIPQVRNQTQAQESQLLGQMGMGQGGMAGMSGMNTSYVNPYAMVNGSNAMFPSAYSSMGALNPMLNGMGSMGSPYLTPGLGLAGHGF